MKIKMLLIRVGREPELIETEQDFKILYRLIDCETIEAIRFHGYWILCDEEGRWNKKERNALGIVGDFLIAGPIRNDQYSSLYNIEQVQTLLDYLERYSDQDLFA